MIDPANLSAYIASRICHDLVSPVSSVTNALDLINSPSDADMREQAQALLETGAHNASVRLQFLRYAFGSAGLSDGTADMHEAKTITETFVATHKPSVSWDIEADNLSFAHVRLMMNLVLIGIESLPRGGVMNVRIRDEAGGLTLTVLATGTRARLNKETEAALSGAMPENGWNARNIQPFFAHMLAEGLGAELTASMNGEEVIIMAHGVRTEG